jgi:SEC-C motif-containing protein
VKSSPCPCGRALAYEDCCGILHQGFEASGRLLAPDAEALMRSRYSAFVLERPDYLLATWHASTRPQRLELESGIRWLGLEVRQCRTLDATHATVEFVARFRSAGRAVRQHEHSRFESTGGLWFYVDGDQNGTGANPVEREKL